MFSSSPPLSNDILLCIVVGFIILYNNDRRKHCLTRSALVKPRFSAWKHLLHHGDEQSFLNITGFDRTSFSKLVQIIYPEGEKPVGSIGRPRLLNNVDRVGLGLIFLGSKMGYKQLSLLFGIIPSSVSIILKDVLQSISANLKADDAAAVIFPDQTKMQYLASLVEKREGVSGIIGFADGLSLFVECSDDELSQAEYYNGHHKATTVNNVFVFSSEGKIIHSTINCPGSWHDSQVALHLMATVERKIGTFSICVDQGFCKTDYMEGKFVGAISRRKLKSLRNLPASIQIAEKKKHDQYISLRQAAEWGMRALQGTFARLKNRLPGDKTFRKMIISSVVLLHNFRTHYVGLNQIATVFNPEYEQYISLDTYDRIARYFEIP